MGESTFAVPRENRYFEDYVVGSVYEFGSIAAEEEEMIAFAKRFDPQDFHTDPEAARNSPHGRLIASGWHTGSLAMRLLDDHYFSAVANIASPGMDEVRWPRPVFPGDVLSIRVTVLEARLSRSKPDRGVVISLAEVINQARELVMTMKTISIILRREPG